MRLENNRERLNQACRILFGRTASEAEWSEAQAFLKIVCRSRKVLPKRKANRPGRLMRGSSSGVTRCCMSIDSSAQFGGRREFVRSFVAGSMLMPGILQQLLADDGGAQDPTDPLLPQSTALTGQGEKRDLPVYDGGRLARRYIQSQAAIKRCRQGSEARPSGDQEDKPPVTSGFFSKRRSGNFRSTASAAPK